MGIMFVFREHSVNSASSEEPGKRQARVRKNKIHESGTRPRVRNNQKHDSGKMNRTGQDKPTSREKERQVRTCGKTTPVSTLREVKRNDS